MVSTRSSSTHITSKVTDEDTFHDSMSEFEDDHSEITLHMLYTQMRKMEIELLCKIDNAKTDIVTKLQQVKCPVKRRACGCERRSQ